MKWEINVPNVFTLPSSKLFLFLRDLRVGCSPNSFSELLPLSPSYFSYFLSTVCALSLSLAPSFSFPLLPSPFSPNIFETVFYFVTIYSCWNWMQTKSMSFFIPIVLHSGKLIENHWFGRWRWIVYEGARVNWNNFLFPS